MKTYKIHLLRHGRTEAGDAGRYVGGKTDVPLSESGKREIMRLDEEENIYPYGAAFFTSPLLRCRQTLSLIYPDQEPIEVPGLAECDFGKFENKSAAELQGDPDFAAWLQGKTPEGVESTEQFVKRSVAAFARIAEELMASGVTDAVVCAHGGTIMSVLSVCGLPEAPFSEWRCLPGRGYTLRLTPSVWMRGYKAEVIGTIAEREETVPEENAD